jgi:hypothetical protein
MEMVPVRGEPRAIKRERAWRGIAPKFEYHLNCSVSCVSDAIQFAVRRVPVSLADIDDAVAGRGEGCCRAVGKREFERETGWTVKRLK